MTSDQEFEIALQKLEDEVVDWYAECEKDTREGGYPLGDAKELRRARKQVIALHHKAIKKTLDAAFNELRSVPKDSIYGTMSEILERYHD